METIYRSITSSACAAVLGLALLTTIAGGTELPVVTGEHWTSATDNEKRAFLVGIATALEVEQEFQAINPQASGASMVPIMIQGLDRFTLTEIMQGVDSWYAGNGEQLDRPVIEVLWYELALPNLPTN